MKISMPKEFLNAMSDYYSGNQTALSDVVNNYAGNEDNTNFYGNVSDSLPLDWWKFLSLKNFINNIMNHDLVGEFWENWRNPTAINKRYLLEKNLIKSYGKHNKDKILGKKYSFEEFFDMFAPYTELGNSWEELCEILWRINLAVLLAESLGVEIKPIGKCPEKDMGISFDEINEFAEFETVSKNIRKIIIKNFLGLFKKKVIR